ncbi:hypothetical protein DPMN_033802 [Dreissena polymorpha]|uniref:Secreted protein n=1 Tax=Dreissena polymorpha TaxID=45954 RepID=A0A9D4RJG9_DREPO|nr:hypothetical protein DPMN_033802 [Dreissena polymorpha]
MQNIESTRDDVLISLVCLMILSVLTDRRHTTLPNVTYSASLDTHITPRGLHLNLYGVPSLCSRSLSMIHSQFWLSTATSLPSDRKSSPSRKGSSYPIFGRSTDTCSSRVIGLG